MRKVLQKTEKPNCGNLKVAENFTENRKAELWKVESCGKFCRKPKSRIVETKKLRRILAKFENSKGKTGKLQKNYIFVKENQFKKQVLPSPNSGLAQLRF